MNREKNSSKRNNSTLTIYLCVDLEHIFLTFNTGMRSTLVRSLSCTAFNSSFQWPNWKEKKTAMLHKQLTRRTISSRTQNSIMNSFYFFGTVLFLCSAFFFFVGRPNSTTWKCEKSTSAVSSHLMLFCWLNELYTIFNFPSYDENDLAFAHYSKLREKSEVMQFIRMQHNQMHYSWDCSTNASLKID